MFATVVNYQRGAANDGVLLRTRTVPIPTSITAVPNYPNKLVVYKIAASKYWQVRCWHAGCTHKRSTKTTKLNLAQRYARWFYEQLLFKHSTHANFIAANSATADADAAKQLTFGAVAAQVYANEQARVERGEYGAGSLRMFRNRLDAQILPAIGAKYIDQITYQLLLLFACIFCTSLRNIGFGIWRYRFGTGQFGRNSWRRTAAAFAHTFTQAFAWSFSLRGFGSTLLPFLFGLLADACPNTVTDQTPQCQCVFSTGKF